MHREQRRAGACARARSLTAGVLLAGLALVAACGPGEEEIAANRQAAIDVVESFGGRLLYVNLLQENRDSLAADIRDTYGPYVTTLLLGGWLSMPGSAPGRETSSPWPSGIEVREATPIGSTGFQITGDILYVTSVDSDPVLRTPFQARVVRGQDDVWRISEWNQ